MKPVASPRPGPAKDPAPAAPWELSRGNGPMTAAPGQPGGPGGAGGAGAGDAAGDANALPRRVKQASLAPQLRADPPRRRTIVASGGPASGPTPAEIRRTMSALQRGWQEGRSQPSVNPGGGPVPTFTPAEAEPPGAASASGGPDGPPPGPAESAGAGETTAGTETWGTEDGT